MSISLPDCPLIADPAEAAVKAIIVHAARMNTHNQLPQAALA
jgi:hypothetical protein